MQVQAKAQLLKLLTSLMQTAGIMNSGIEIRAFNYKCNRVLLLRLLLLLLMLCKLVNESSQLYVRLYLMISKFRHAKLSGLL